MVVNTVQIPDITSEMLEAYPYAVILTDGTNFYLIMTAEGTLYASGSLVIPAGSYHSYSYAYNSNNTAEQIVWTDNGVVEASSYAVGSLHFAWTNHEIYTAITDDSGNYVASEEVSFGEAYMIPHGYPAIPVNLLKQYPYAMITPNALALSETPMYLGYLGSFDLDPGVFANLGDSSSETLFSSIMIILAAMSGGGGAMYTGITSDKTTPVIYEMSAQVWVISTDEEPAFSTGMSNGVVWANHDVKKAYPDWLAAEDSADYFVFTDELLVPENMCMLPSNDWYKEVYPYQIMVTVNESGTASNVMNVFIASPNPLYVINSGGPSVVPNIDFSGEYYPPYKPNIPFFFAMGSDGAWMVKEEVYLGAYTPKAMIAYYALMLMSELGYAVGAGAGCLWSNHDIKTAVVDEETYKVTATNNVLFEGTGAIVPSNKNYEVSREWLIQNAYFQRMLTGIEGEITPFDSKNIGTAISETRIAKTDVAFYSAAMEVPF